ncbi:MAG: DNA primase [Planctomycetota bacterium]|jgi:DNA primase
MAGAFDKAIINQVQQTNDIVDVISEHVRLVKKGREMVGLCPFHDDHRPSMFVNPAKQIFKCFACGAGGSVFTFVQMRENLSFPQTIQRLAERVGIRLKPLRSDKEGSTRPEGDPNRLAQVNTWAAKYFRQNLHQTQEGKWALDYVAERQITRESAEKWQLGLALSSSDDLVRAAGKIGLPGRLLAQAGLVVGRQGAGSLGDKFVNRLMFPICDVTERVIGFGGRTLDGAEAKYINSPTTALFDKSNSLYGLQQARHQIVATGAAIVVEGYTDCIMAHQFGCANVVASLGTSFTEGQARILRRYAKRIVLVFDSDAAGLEAANRALEICLGQRIDIKLASVPQGKDPCDFLLSAGKEAFEKLINKAADVFEFKWKRLNEKFAGEDNLVDNKAAIEEFVQAVATGIWAGKLAAIDRGLIVNRLSGIIGLSSREINAELSRRIARAAKSASYGGSAETKMAESLDWGQGFFAAAQREVLEVLLNGPRLFESVRQTVTPDLFDVPILRQVAGVLVETFTAEREPSLADVLARAESPELGSAIAELAQSGEKKGNLDCRLAGALEAIERHLAQKRKSQIKAVENQRQFLQRFVENTEKQNPRSVGMV